MYLQTTDQWLWNINYKRIYFMSYEIYFKIFTIVFSERP